jgi:hypothetical protein
MKQEVKRRNKMSVSVLSTPAEPESKPIALTSLYGEMAPYSRSEKELFNLMPKTGKRVSSIALSEKRRDKFGWDVSHGRNAVIVIMNSLSRKVDANREGFHIAQTNRTGPYPLEYWIVPGPRPEDPPEPKKTRKKARA